MLLILLLAQEEVLDAVGVLRDDPLLYLVVALPLFAVAGMSLMYRSKHVENKELRAENKALVENIMHVNRLSTEAITQQVEVMRVMRADQKEALAKYETRADQIYDKLNEIKVRTDG